ncbi:MAG: hypothetical protein J5J06_12130 [Phycisphaerae bacterium]|nr:hypothetical protein [Phycisphaerae bacterium]
MFKRAQNFWVVGLAGVWGAFWCISPCLGQQSGTISLVPVGVVGGNPPGTVIDGSSITLEHGGTVVEFEVRATWTGLADIQSARVDCTAGCRNGVGAPLSIYHYEARPISGAYEGAYVSVNVCLNNGRAGCDEKNGQPACDLSTEGPCVVNTDYVFSNSGSYQNFYIQYRLGSTDLVLQNVAGAPVPQLGDYAGTVLLNIPASAFGDYEVGFVLNSSRETAIRNGVSYLDVTVTPAEISILSNPCAGVQCALTTEPCLANRPTILADGSCACVVAPVADHAPCPADMDPCTQDVCLAGVCEHPDVECGEGRVCDALTGLCHGPLGEGRMGLFPVGVLGGGDFDVNGDRLVLYETDVVVELEVRAQWTGLLGLAQLHVECPGNCGNGAGGALSLFNIAGGLPPSLYLATDVCLYSQRPGCPASGQPASGQAPCEAANPGDGPCVENPRFLFTADPRSPVFGVYFSPILGICEAFAVNGSAGGGIAFHGENEYFATLLVYVPPYAHGTYTIELGSDELSTYLANEHTVPLPITLSPAIIEIFDPCLDTICTPSREECRETVRSKVDGHTCECVEQVVENGTPCADDGRDDTLDRCIAGACYHLSAPQLLNHPELQDTGKR